MRDAGGLGQRDRSPRPGWSRRAGRSLAPRRRAAPAGPSGNGKNASDAATDPAARSPARSTREPARVDPVDLAHADADGRRRRREQDRVRLDRADGTPGEAPGRRASLVGRPRRPPASTAVGSSPGASIGRPSAANRPPGTDTRLDGAFDRSGLGDEHAQVLLAPSVSSAPGSKAGATMTSVKIVGQLVRPFATLTGRFVAITPPNALTGSQACALRWASAMSVADRDAARVGVLDDRDARLGEVVRGTPGRVGVDVVVVAHLLAGQLLAVGDATVGPRRRCTAPRAGAGSRRSAARRRVRRSRAIQPGKPLGGALDLVVRRDRAAEPDATAMS